MRTYSSMPAGEAAKLLVTAGGTTRTVATVPDPQAAADLARALSGLAANLLIDAANPRLPEALRTLGVRQVEVQPAPGTLRLSVLAQRAGDDLHPGGGWVNTGIVTVWHLALALRHLAALPAGPSRSIRHELADLLGTADGPVVTATVTADGYDGDSLTLMVTSWLASATDEEVDGILGDGFGPGYGTDAVAHGLEDLTGHLMGNGFSVHLDPGPALAWVRANRPHLLDGGPDGPAWI